MHPSRPAAHPGQRRHRGRSTRAALASVFAAAALIAGLAGLAGLAGSVSLRAAWAQDEPSFEGVTIEIFGAGVPSAAPENALVLRRVTFEPGAALPPHSHPGAVTLSVAAGELAYTLLEGEASVQRGPDADEAGEVEPLEIDAETLLDAGDSVFVEGTIATASNPGDEPAIVWASSLLEADAPFLIEAVIEEDEPVEEASPEATVEDEEEPEPEGVRVSLDEFTIRLSSAIPAGETTFVITNRGSVNHSFVIVGEEADAALDAPVAPGETVELTVDLPAGTYQILCPVANHDSLGMTRELTVTDGDGAGADEAEDEDAGDDSGDAEDEAEADAPVDGEIQIAGFQFGPAEAEVTAGTTVTWTNFDGATHTATAEDGTFDSGDIEAGEEFSFTFEEPGTFAYLCEIHPEMTGTVTVTD